LQVLPESIVNGQRDYQGRHTRRYPDNRNRRNDSDHRLPAFRSQITTCNEQLKVHEGI
jgi:hypothetical protein